MTSWLQSQFLPQSLGLNVNAEDKGNAFPVGVPVKTQLPHSSVAAHPLNETIREPNSASLPIVLIFICCLLISRYSPLAVGGFSPRLGRRIALPTPPAGGVEAGRGPRTLARFATRYIVQF